MTHVYACSLHQSVIRIRECITAIRDIKPARDPRERDATHGQLLGLISIRGLRKDCWMFDQVYRVLMTINKLLIYLAHN